MSPWLWLALAIAVELIGTSALKESRGFSRMLLSVGALMAYGLALLFLSKAMERLPLGIAYAVWSGLGTLGAALIGWSFFKETLGPRSLLGIVFIIAGAILLKLNESTKGGS